MTKWGSTRRPVLVRRVPGWFSPAFRGPRISRSLTGSPQCSSRRRRPGRGRRADRPAGSGPGRRIVVGIRRRCCPWPLRRPGAASSAGATSRRAPACPRTRRRGGPCVSGRFRLFSRKASAKLFCLVRISYIAAAAGTSASAAIRSGGSDIVGLGVGGGPAAVGLGPLDLGESRRLHPPLLDAAGRSEVDVALRPRTAGPARGEALERGGRVARCGPDRRSSRSRAPPAGPAGRSARSGR